MSIKIFDKEIPEQSEVTALQVEVNARVKTADIQDNLTSTATNKPLSANQGKVVNDTLAAHASAVNNPHTVTKAQVGLGNCDNTSDADKPVSTAVATALNAKLDADKVGAASGVAPLDENSKVPSGYLPSYVDDVLEYENRAAFPEPGETGKIYVDKEKNTTYRWSGTTYVQIKGDLVLGNDDSNAYYGGKGATAYAHSQLTSGNPHNVSKTDVGLGNCDNTADADKPISTATQTALDLKYDKAGGTINGNVTVEGTKTLTAGGLTVKKPDSVSSTISDGTSTLKFDSTNGVLVSASGLTGQTGTVLTSGMVVDNLTSSTATGTPLSAKQGYVLDQGKLNKTWSTAADKGKVLYINDSQAIAAKTITGTCVKATLTPSTGYTVPVAAGYGLLTVVEPSSGSTKCFQCFLTPSGYVPMLDSTDGEVTVSFTAGTGWVIGGTGTVIWLATYYEG